MYRPVGNEIMNKKNNNNQIHFKNFTIGDLKNIIKIINEDY